MSEVTMSITDIEDEIDEVVNGYVEEFTFQAIDPIEIDIEDMVENWIDINREFIEQKIMDEIECKVTNFNEDMYNELEETYDFALVRDRFCFDPESIRGFLENYVESPFNYEHVTLGVDDFLEHIHTQWLKGDAAKEFRTRYVQESWRL